MRVLPRLTILMVVLAVPAAARAQVYPERVMSKAKAAAAMAAYQQHSRDGEREEQTERTSKTLHVGASGSIDLHNVAGDITVTRGGGGDATLEIVKTAHARTSDDAKAMLGMVTVDVNERPGRAEVRAHYPQGDMFGRGSHRGVNVSVAYTLTAPAGVRLNIESISGDVTISDIKGELSVSTISGDVKISGGGRVGALKTISGSIDLTDAQVDGTLSAGSVSGDVTLRHVRAHEIDGETVSGEVRIEDAQSDKVSAHSTSGDLSYTGPLIKSGRYEFKTFSGEVRLAIPASTGFELNANSFSGDVHSDLSITTRGNLDTRGRHRTLAGTYGDGSAVLDVTTFSGRITINKK